MEIAHQNHDGLLPPIQEYRYQVTLRRGLLGAALFAQIMIFSDWPIAGSPTLPMRANGSTDALSVDEDLHPSAFLTIGECERIMGIWTGIISYHIR